MEEKILQNTLKQLLVEGKGILAADESTDSIGKRFGKIDVLNTEDNREAYRELLFTSPGIEKYISGVILYDETIRQTDNEGVLLRDILKEKGIVLGIKVDQGTAPLNSNELITRGIEGLSDRLLEYFSMGARFAKWRAVIKIGPKIPSEKCIEKNGELLAAYAKLCQEAQIIPIVEPEVLSEGEHSSEKCFDVTSTVLKKVFDILKKRKVNLRHMILKPNMVVPGHMSGEEISPFKVANLSLGCYRESVPPEVPAIAFLSGGQSEAEACANLNAMATYDNLPWFLTYSFGRALQNSTLEKWGGAPSKVNAAQKVFITQAKAASLAQQGKYKPER